MEQKAMTVRLDPDQAAELEAIAEINGGPVSEEIRQAIAEHIEAKRKDRAFQARLKASIERHREILEKLAR
jgi:predicted transcriptional regulator